MLHYYEHISDNKFRQLKSDLRNLETNIIEPFCNQNGFTIEKRKYYSETLAMNLHRVFAGMIDHIGFYYIDREGENKFEFYFSKHVDRDKKRHSHKESLGEFNAVDLSSSLSYLLEKSQVSLKSLSISDCESVTDLTG